MAVDTHIKAQTEASAITVANSLKCWQRTVDFSVHNLADGAWFELFDVPAGTLVVSGTVEVLTVDAGGGTLTVGFSGGHTIKDTTVISSKIKVVISHPRAMFNAGAAEAVTIRATTAAITTAVVRVTLVTLDVDGAPSRGATGTA